MSLEQEADIDDSDDSDDEDYVYTGVEDLPSEEESDGEPEDNAEDDDDAPKHGRKRKGSQKTKRNKSSKIRKKDGLKNENKTDATNDADEENKQPAVALEEEDKKKTDSLWADFLKDTGSVLQKQSTSTETSGKDNTAPENRTESHGIDKQNKVLVTKVFHFAGEEVKLTKEVPANSAEAQVASSGDTSNLGKSAPSKGGRKSDSGLSSVLNQIGKKNKIGTLEKSKIDWEQFKKSKGLEEDIQTHNRGKAGYLEKQDFLQRADLRQFEIEKDMRTRSRSNR